NSAHSNALARQFSAEGGIAVSLGGQTEEGSLALHVLCPVPDGAGACRKCCQIKHVPTAPHKRPATSANRQHLRDVGFRQHKIYFDSNRFAWSDLLFLVSAGRKRGRDWMTGRKDLIFSR